MANRILQSIGVVLVLVVASAPMWSQATGALTGHITDASGARVENAEVKLTSETIGLVRSTKTATDGVYLFPQLPPGTYKLEITASGFKSATREHVAVPVGLTSALDLQLTIGARNEIVNVLAETATINTQDASIGTPFNETQIRQLPLEGRSIVGLLSLQAGAVYLPTGDIRSGSVNGGRSDQANITLDGVDVNDAESQTTAYESALRTPLDSVAEFRTTTTNAGAEQGYSSGAQVQLVTKGGTNSVHGSAYYFDRNTAFSSNEYFNKLAGLKTPQLNKHIFGASAGGPIRRNRLFIFGNYEGLREDSEDPILRGVPSDSLRDGVIIYACADPALCPGGTVNGLTGTHSVPAGYWGLTPSQFAAIDPQGIGPNPAVIAHFNEYPHPNDPGYDALNLMGARFNAPIKDTLNTAVLRLDYNLNASGTHTLFWRGVMQDDTLNGDPQFQGQPPTSVGRVTNKGMVIGYESVYANNLVNSFRWGYTRIQEDTVGVQTQPQIGFILLDDLPAKTPSFGRRVPTNNIRDDLTWQRGRHTLQFGTDIRFTRIPRYTNAGSFNSVLIDPSWAADLGRTYTPGQSTCNLPGCSAVPAVSGQSISTFSDASFDLWGLLTRGSGNYNYTKTGSLLASGEAVRRRFGADDFEWYVQDKLRIRPTLTVTLGLRYSLASPPWETNGNQVSPTPGWSDIYQTRAQNAKNGIPSSAIPAITFNISGPANSRPNFYPWDTKNFAPRVAVAWNPHSGRGIKGRIFGDGKTVIRGGYSIVYDHIGQALANTYDSGGGAFGLSTSLSAPYGLLDASSAPRFTGISALPGAPVVPDAPPGGFPVTPAPDNFIVSNTIDSGLKTPYSHLVNFSIGRELPHDVSLELAYVGRYGRRLLARRDFAQQIDLVDPQSKTDYYTAASTLAKYAAEGDPIGLSVGRPTSQVSPIPYWEDLFPGAAGHPICNIDGLGASATATQVVYDAFKCVRGDYSTALVLLDVDYLCQAYGTCSRFGPWSYFLSQFCCMAGQSTIGYSNYDAFEVVLKKRYSGGLQFDFNYTFSHSRDLTSDVERGSSYGNFFSGGLSSYIVDAWNPGKQYSYSDFDTRHQVNANWRYALPFGRGRKFGATVPGGANQFIGGWQVTGVWRWTSGFPFNVLGCGSCFPTNQTLVGNAELLAGAGLPATVVNKNGPGGYPNAFSDAAQARVHFRPEYPGEVGLRNVLRGDGYFSVDLGVGKEFHLPWEKQLIQFRWETFNLTNTPKFDTGSITATLDVPSTFGRYSRTLATCDGRAGRCMQFSLRYEF